MAANVKAKEIFSIIERTDGYMSSIDGYIWLQSFCI